MRLDALFFKKFVEELQILSDTEQTIEAFCTDSKNVKKNEIFLAIKGSKFDGHDFIQEALSRGCAGVFLDQNKIANLANIPDSLKKDKLFAAVPNTVLALVQLAKAWRNQFTIPVVGVTGSVGKTSTKEMLTSILRHSGKNVLSSFGNQNTEIGASLNILKMRDEHEVAVFELGINKPGEMEKLAEIVRPTTAVVTSIGHCHMAGLGSMQEIAMEKRDIFKTFESTSIGVINGDLPVLSSVAYAHPVIRFGAKMTNQIQARKIKVNSDRIEFSLKIYNKKYPVVLQSSHMGFVFNTLAATALAKLLGLDDNVIVEAIQRPFVVSGRFELKKIKGSCSTLINDCYNANPESMKAALLAFEKIETKSKKIAVLGDMLELGVNGPFWHRQVGRFIKKVTSLDRIILVGGMMQEIKQILPAGLLVECSTTWQDALKKLEKHLETDSIILIKGSNGTGLGGLVKELAES
ncbi:MAG: UDP-N-acetylmuramoyl-tripeptide-D-alanyl-D-alanine ligase [candidate division TM6 bacterium GW2011_GWF2_32_72]|nr:MAG: UDP-N-acetylmuramoyl-tripeptide-D-alanyl-D-alanine ligase [candidate division TM6 bacterium GW2011_GWF2_32_72]